MTSGSTTDGEGRRSALLPLIKWIVILASVVGTTLCLMAVVGRLTDIFWVRVAGAVVTAILVPALIADRLLPETDPKPKGLVSTVFAVTWLAFTLLFLLAAPDHTKPLLVAEGDRLIADGWDTVGALSHLLAGGRPPVPTPDSPLPAASTDLTARAKAASIPESSAPVADVVGTVAPTAPKATASAKPNAKPSAVAANLPPLPPLLRRGSNRKGCTYPSAPYGTEVGEVLPPTLKWQGFAPGSDKPTTVTVRDLFDCDGKGGINAVVIESSQYG